MIFAALGLMLAYSFNNRWRGSNLATDLEIAGNKVYPFHKFLTAITSKVGCSIIFGLLATAYVWEQYSPSYKVLLIILPIIAVGMRLWAAPGWGKYFSALNGNYAKDEEEIAWIDKVADKLITDTDYEANRKRGMLSMALRGWYTGQFMFYALAGLNYYLTHDVLSTVLIALVSLGMLGQGFWYWLATYTPKNEGVENAERMTGIWIGLLHVVAFSLMF